MSNSDHSYLSVLTKNGSINKPNTNFFVPETLDSPEATKHILDELRLFLIAKLTEAEVLPLHNFDPCNVSIDKLANLIPDPLIDIELLYNLIHASYFKVSQQRRLKAKAKHKQKLDKLNKLYFKTLAPNLSNSQ